jgi:RHS repeat-associated protein
MTSDDLVHFVISDKSGNSEYYTLSGYFAYITKAIDRNGNELDYTHSMDSSGNMGIPVLSVADPKSGRYIAFTYDSSTAQLRSISDSAGRTITYAYTSESDGGDWKYLSSVTLPHTPDWPTGTTESYTYDSANNLATVIDGNSNLEVSNVYGVTGPNWNRVLQQTAHGGTCTLAYDDTVSTAHKVTYTDYKGFVTEYTDDGNRNITKKVVHTTGLHSGVPSTTTYETDYTYGTGSTLHVVGVPSGTTVETVDGPVNDSGQPNNCYKIEEKEPDGNGISWTYDQYGNVLTETKHFALSASVDSSKGSQSTTSTITYTYESRFNKVASKTDASGTTTYDYGSATSNPKGNLLKITFPATASGTATETFTYNDAGQVLSDTTPDGETVNSYDSSSTLTNGYLLSKINDYGSGKLNAETDYTYDEYGNIASTEDPNRHTTTFTYNAQAQLIETDGASGEVDMRNYDANGQLTINKKRAPGSTWQETENVYNTYDELWKTRQYTSASTYLETSYTYDSNSNRTSVTDPLVHTVNTTYDERDKPYLITDALGNHTQYDYDANGNLTKLTDELGHVTNYLFDGFDRMEQKTFPDSSYQTCSYDAVGNITSMLTPTGNTITQTYDSRNRMLTQSYTSASGPSTITNVYDIMGRVSTTTEGGASLSYGYDALGRNISFTDQAGRSSSYTYDLNGHRLSATYPTGITVQRVYDSSSRLCKLQDSSAMTMSAYTYDTLDRVTGVVLANSTSIAYSNDLLNRLNYVNNSLNGTTRNYSYVYDDCSRVTSITEPRGLVAINAYSDRNEVKGITEPSGSPFADQSFAYDAGFNRSTWTLGSITTSYSVNNLNQYSTVSGLTAPVWNTDGGLQTFAGNTYVYDALQRLTEVDSSNGKTVFSYDPLGRRVKKVDENTSGVVISTFQYHYDESEVAVEYQPATTWTYYLGLGLDQVVLRDSGSAKQWYYRDGHGSTSALTDNSGNVLEQYEYNAQGQFQITNSSGTVEAITQIANDLLYTGRNYDYETGNYFYRARYYNPQLGRFISRDSLSGAEFSQGTNLYAYCRNNF